MTTAAAPKIDLASMDYHDLAELAIELAGRVVPEVRMTESAFERCFLDHYKAEWIAGKVVLLSPVNVDHNDLVLWFNALFFALEQELGLGKALSDFWLRLPAQQSRRVPDSMFVLTANREKGLKYTTFDGIPDVVVEVISIDSQKRDRNDKYHEYQRAGVREYWIIDPFTRSIDLFRHNGKSFVEIAPVAGTLISSVISGLAIKVDPMFRHPLPRVSTVAKNIKSQHRVPKKKNK